MPSPEITAYLAARAKHVHYLTTDWSSRSTERRALAAASARNAAWDALNTGQTFYFSTTAGPGGGADFFAAMTSPEPTANEDKHVFFPILVDEHGGDREAAEVAWALGARPAGYPTSEGG